MSRASHRRRQSGLACTRTKAGDDDPRRPSRALLAAGATLIGKTITDELAFSLEGVNAHYGTPVNPACPDRLPGGSSSGSAVAVAAGLVDFALGTDTGGSVRVPASFVGVFGFRPTPWRGVARRRACRSRRLTTPSAGSRAISQH